MKEKAKPEEPSAAFSAEVSAARERFVESMDNDLNTSAALAAIFDFVRFTYQKDAQDALSGGDFRIASEFMQEVEAILNILRSQPQLLDEEIAAHIEARQAARRRKDFAEADRIREWLSSKGIQLEDTKDGVRWKRLH